MTSSIAPSKLAREISYSPYAQEAIPDLLICSICLSVMKDPQQGKCGHCFCIKCIDAVYKATPGNSGKKSNRQTKCPTCRGELKENEMMPNLIAKQFINNIKIRCPETIHESASEQCEWIGTIGDLSSHQSVCPVAAYNQRILREQYAAKLGIMDYAINRIAPVKLFKCHSRALKLSADSYCMKYEVRLPNLPIPPEKTYPPNTFMEKFMDLDLHRTLHSPHNCTILDANEPESNAEFVRILMSRYQHYCGSNQRAISTFQGGLVLYMATAVESLVYMILSHSKKCGAPSIDSSVDYAIKSLYLSSFVSNTGDDYANLCSLLTKYIQRMSELEVHRSEDFPVNFTTPFSNEVFEKLSKGNYSYTYTSARHITLLLSSYLVANGFLWDVICTAVDISKHNKSDNFLAYDDVSRQCDEDILNLVGLTVKEAAEMEEGKGCRLLIDCVRKAILLVMRDSNLAKIIVSDADAAMLQCGYYGTKSIEFTTDYRCTSEHSNTVSLVETPASPDIPVSRSAKAGLQLSVYSFEKLMRDYGITRLSATAPVYLAAVCEYVSAELAELAGNVAKCDESVFILREHVYQAIFQDEELKDLFTFNVSNPFTGALARNEPTHFFNCNETTKVDRSSAWWEKDSFEGIGTDESRSTRVRCNDVAGLSPMNVTSIDANGFTPDRLMCSIMAVLQQCHPSSSLFSGTASNGLNYCDDDTCENIRYSEGILSIVGLIELLAIHIIKTADSMRKKSTFSHLDIEIAVKVVMRGQLIVHAVNEGKKAIGNFNRSN